jgi:hypothetical protein
MILLSIIPLKPANFFSMHIVQILLELNQGGVERGTVELSRELVKRGQLAEALHRQKEIPRTGLREYILRRFTLEQMVEKTIGVYRTAVSPTA